MSKRPLVVVVWGLGHIGAVCAAGFASLGHVVRGVEPDPERRARLAGRGGPLPEKGLSRLLARALASRRLTLHASGAGLVRDADVSVVCVGADGPRGGAREAGPLLAVAREIGRGRRGSADGHVVAVRSTLAPGFLARRLIPEIERAAEGASVPVAVVPELLREGRAIADFRRPALIVLGAEDARARSLLVRLFDGLPGRRFVVAPEEAVLFKLVNNAFHAVKASFANEVGRLGRALDLDPSRIMSLVAHDRRLGASAAYLEPGFAIGGSCLPRDTRALARLARARRVAAPILASILPSNARHLDEVARRVLALRARTVCVAGLTFKAGTGDLRGSAALDLVRMLRAAGRRVVAFDPDLAEPLGAVARGIRPILRRSVAEVVREADAVVVTQGAALFHPLRLACRRAGIPVVETWRRKSLPRVRRGRIVSPARSEKS